MHNLYMYTPSNAHPLTRLNPYMKANWIIPKVLDEALLLKIGLGCCPEGNTNN